MAHTCGTKSIAQYCYEDRDTETEQEPTRAATWRKTRYTNKKNGWVDQTSEEVYVSLKLNKLVNGSYSLRMMDECHNLQNSDQNPLLVSQSLLAPNVQQVRLVAACGRKRAEYLVRLQGLTQLLDHHNPTARAGPFCLALNGMALLVTLRPDPSPHSAFLRPKPRSWLCQHNIRAVPFILLCGPRPGPAFWEARSHRAHGPAGLPAVVGILPFPGQRLGWMRDLLHEERYGRR
ncbi:UNVERIFIED_CONTAM: hypothetical protein Scaly_2213100 [Sesamum calycinum]|uniref:Uncharacterized protein n=1 Tax=Sesamum calycinum TaxID=2727403 RepID=A0AAW2MSQ3_9LAMI